MDDELLYELLLLQASDLEIAYSLIDVLDEPELEHCGQSIFETACCYMYAIATNPCFGGRIKQMAAETVMKFLRSKGHEPEYKYDEIFIYDLICNYIPENKILEDDVLDLLKRGPVPHRH